MDGQNTLGNVVLPTTTAPASQPQHPCPSCGYCPHCGRGGPQQPYYPVYPAGPIWIVPTVYSSAQ